MYVCRFEDFRIVSPKSSAPNFRFGDKFVFPQNLKIWGFPICSPKSPLRPLPDAPGRVLVIGVSAEAATVLGVLLGLVGMAVAIPGGILWLSGRNRGGPSLADVEAELASAEAKEC